MPTEYRVTYGNNIREAVTVVETLIGQGASEVHTAYIPESGKYSITYRLPDSPASDLIDEMEHLKNRVHNLNLYLAYVMCLLDEKQIKALEEHFSGLPGFSDTEAEEDL